MRIRGRRLAAAALVGALTLAGLVQASPTPVPVPVPDPIGDVIAQPPAQPGPVQEEAPPAPGEVPAVVPPVRQTDAEREAAEAAADEIEAELAEAEEDAERPAPNLNPDQDRAPRPRRQVAILQALDKITAETIRFEVPVGAEAEVRWRGLLFRVRACETTAPTERARDHIAYVEVRSRPSGQGVQTPPRRIFRGWMFSSSPGLNPLEHPLYDAWVVACQADTPSS